jgi:hypothetical protein
MRRVFNDAVISIGALTVLFAILLAVDERVREYAVGLVRRTDISTAGGRMVDLGGTLLLAARDQSMEHAPLTIFAIAACVLVAFMFRT